jgi:hypothetical protein
VILSVHLLLSPASWTHWGEGLTWKAALSGSGQNRSQVWQPVSWSGVSSCSEQELVLMSQQDNSVAGEQVVSEMQRTASPVPQG